MHTVRVYLIAADADLGIKVSNFINSSGSSCIISQLKSGDYKQQLLDLSDNVKDFEMCVVASTQPTLMVIESNKMSGVRAIECRNSEDVAEALGAGANVVIFSPSALGRDTPELLGPVVGVRAQQRRLAPMPQPKPQQRPQRQQQRQQQVQRTPEQEQYEDDRSPLWDRKKGITKNIKNIFGVE